MSSTTPSLNRTTKTPIRAITSSLASRSAPSIPSPAAAYDPHVKSTLRHRLVYHVFVYSAILSWSLTVLWTTWNQGGVSKMGLGGVFFNPFRPTILALAALNWTMGALPVIVLRKVYLTALRTSATSPSKILEAAFMKPSTTRALVTYVSSALCVAALHAVIAFATENGSDPRLGLFVKSKKHPHYLNGRLIFLLFTQAALACGYLLRNNLLDRFVFRWSSMAHSPLTLQKAILSFFSIIIFASLALPIGALSFGFTRTLLPLVYKFPFVRQILKPFTAHFLRGSWTLTLPVKHITLLIRAWFLAFTTLATWESADVFFDAFIPRPVTVSSIEALVSGISSTDRSFAYFAYSELATLAAEETNAASVQRTALFTDSKYSPTLWAQLLRESLLLLGADYQLLLGRGVPPKPVSATPAKTESTSFLSSLPLPLFPSTPLVKQASVFKNPSPASPVQVLIDGLAADGPLAQAVDSVHVPAVFLASPSVAANVTKPEASPVPVSPAAKLNLVGTVTSTLSRGICALGRAVPLPKPAVDALAVGKTWWYEDRLSRVVDKCLQQREMDVAVVQVLTHLTCASLGEDTYGVVQKDIPKIIEAILSFLTAVEAYQTEISAMYGENASVEQRIEVERGKEILAFIADELKDGIARIVGTFGRKLEAFKFAPRIADKLQGFVDFNS